MAVITFPALSAAIGISLSISSKVMYSLSPKICCSCPTIISVGIVTSPFSSTFTFSASSSVAFEFRPLSSCALSIFFKISPTMAGALNMLAMFLNRRLLIKPRLTTSSLLIFLGMLSTCRSSICIIFPSSSSAMTGKKFISWRMFCCRSSVVPLPPAVLFLRLLANSSYSCSVRAGSKSKT